MPEKQLDFPNVAIIPYYIQKNKILSKSAKLFFGQITGLSMKLGYIWATDEQLAHMVEEPVRNVKTWLKELADAKFICRKTRNYPVREEGQKLTWEKRRKIFILPYFSEEDRKLEKERESAENSPSNGSAENSPSNGSAENSPSINKHSNSESLNNNPAQSAEPPAIVIPSSSLDELEIEDTLRVKILSEFSQEAIAIAVKRCLQWEGRPSDAIGIMTTLKRSAEWKDNPTPEDVEKCNKEWLKTLEHLDRKKIGGLSICIGNKYIEFAGTMNSITFTVNQKDFKKQVSEYIKRIT